MINEIKQTREVVARIPSWVLTMSAVSVILMNLLANKSINTGIPWLALDSGIIVSWVSFLMMDIITKYFGAKASIYVSMQALAINLFTALLLLAASMIPGIWGQTYATGVAVVNDSLNQTIAGTWYVWTGSTISFILSSVTNSSLNEIIGRHLKKDNFLSFIIRSYVSTIIGQIVDNLTFALIVSHVFFGWTLMQCISCAVAGAVIELLCEAVFSPLGYQITMRWKEENL